MPKHLPQRHRDAEETQRKTLFPKVFSAKTLRLCVSAVGFEFFTDSDNRKTTT